MPRLNLEAPEAAIVAAEAAGVAASAAGLHLAPMTVADLVRWCGVLDPTAGPAESGGDRRPGPRIIAAGRRLGRRVLPSGEALGWSPGRSTGSRR